MRDARNARMAFIKVYSRWNGKTAGTVKELELAAQNNSRNASLVRDLVGSHALSDKFLALCFS